MSNRKEPLGPTQWVNDNDEFTLLAYVTVGQKLGTVGHVTLERHHLRDDGDKLTYAQFRGDGTDNSLDALIRTLETMLSVAKERRILDCQLAENRA